MADTPQPRPLVGLPVAGGHIGPAPAAPRHETAIPDEPEAVLRALAAAASQPGTDAVRALLAAHPELIEGWARLGERLLDSGEPVLAYACARVGYHRGLDRLRRHGWGGTGMVRWAHAGNRGFLRSLRLLLVCAAAIGELDEAARCRQFLLDLDPDDGLGAAAMPDRPGPDWRAPAPPP